MADTQERERVDSMTGEVLGPEHGDDQLPSLVTDGALIGGLTKAEIDIQITTAHRFRRVISTVKRSIETFATLDTETAEACVYRKPQRVRNPDNGKWENSFIEGPSIRFAEIVMQAWGNCRVASRRTDLTEVDVEATGIFHDLESNVAIARSVRRGILTTERDGKRATKFPVHLIETNSNAIASIALRNAILAAVPKGIWNPGYKAAYRAARGEASTLGERREKMLAAAAEIGLSQAILFEILDVRGRDDIDLDKMFDAVGLMNAIRDGETTVEQLLADARGNKPAPTLDQAFGQAGGRKASAPRESKAKASASDSGEKRQEPSKSDLDMHGVDAGGEAGLGGVIEGRPTSTGPAQSAETGRGSSAPATAASGGSPAGASSPADTAKASDAGEKDQGDAGKSKSQASSGGLPAADDGFPGDRPAPGRAPITPTAPVLTDAMIEAFNAFAEAIKPTTSWLQIKPMLNDFRATSDFAKAPDAAKIGTFRLIHDHVQAIRDPVSPKADRLFFEIWLYHGQASGPAIEDAWAALTRSKDYTDPKVSEDEKQRLAELMEAMLS